MKNQVVKIKKCRIASVEGVSVIRRMHERKHCLTHAGLLTSYRGPNGAAAFQTPPDKILLSDVVRILEGDDFFDKCLLGMPGCGELALCPMHAFWKNIRGVLKQEFERTTLADMGWSIQKRRLRLMP